MNRAADPKHLIIELLAGRDCDKPEWPDLSTQRWRWLSAVVTCRSSRREGDLTAASSALLRAAHAADPGPGASMGSGARMHALMEGPDLPRLRAMGHTGVWRDLAKLAEAEWRRVAWVFHRLRFAASRDDALRYPFPQPEPLEPLREAMVLTVAEYEALWPPPSAPSGDGYGVATAVPLTLEEQVRRARNLLTATVPDWLAENLDPEGREPFTGQSAGKEVRRNLGGYEGVQGRARHLASTLAPFTPSDLDVHVSGTPAVDDSARRARLLGLGTSPGSIEAYEQSLIDVEDLFDTTGARPVAYSLTNEQLAHTLIAALEGLEIQRLAGVDPLDIPTAAAVVEIVRAGSAELARRVREQAQRPVGSAVDGSTQQGVAT